MHSKMLKNQEQSEQLQDKELEALMGKKLDDLVKNFSLRNKFAKWVSVAASIVGIFASMTMPAEAIYRTRDCNDSGYMRIMQGSDMMCFAEAGEADVVIADVHILFSRNNAGYVLTNKGIYTFEKQDEIDFMKETGGPVTILEIRIH